MYNYLEFFNDDRISEMLKFISVMLKFVIICCQYAVDCELYVTCKMTLSYSYWLLTDVGHAAEL